MSVQTTVSLATALSKPGTADAGPMRKSSRAAEGAVAFGLVVSRGTDVNTQCSIGGTDVLGISLRDLARLSDVTSLAYTDEEAVSIAEDGAIFVICTNGATAGDAVTYNQVTGVVDGGAVAGDVVALTGWVHDATVAAGAIGLVKKV